MPPPASARPFRLVVSGVLVSLWVPCLCACVLRKGSPRLLSLLLVLSFSLCPALFASQELSSLALQERNAQLAQQLHTVEAQTQASRANFERRQQQLHEALEELENEQEQLASENAQLRSQVRFVTEWPASESQRGFESHPAFLLDRGFESRPSCLCGGLGQ